MKSIAKNGRFFVDIWRLERFIVFRADFAANFSEFLLLKTAGAALVLEKKVEENEEGEEIPLQNSRSASENDLSQRHWIIIENQ